MQHVSFIWNIQIVYLNLSLDWQAIYIFSLGFVGMKKRGWDEGWRKKGQWCDRLTGYGEWCGLVVVVYGEGDQVRVVSAENDLV